MPLLTDWGDPAAFLLSPGNDNDSVHAVEWMNMTDIAGSNLFGDKAYGTKEILAYSREHGADVVIPPKSSAKEPWEADCCLYKERRPAECFFQKIKWFRRVAARYDKLDVSLQQSQVNNSDFQKNLFENDEAPSPITGKGGPNKF